MSCTGGTFSGFPKSLDISKAIDALHGAEREVVGTRKQRANNKASSAVPKNASAGAVELLTAPATDDAKRYQGYGTGIKPAIEPALLLRKPISESSIARNVLRWGTGALNIDACRFAPGDPMWLGPDDDYGRSAANAEGVVAGSDRGPRHGPSVDRTTEYAHELGRFPANLIHVPKASRAEREMGCEGLPARTGAEAVERTEGSAGIENPRAGAGRSAGQIRNYHPCVKPLKLMQWLVRLVGCQPGSVVLDPYMGSGTTGMAAVGQGYRFVGCEMDPDYYRIAAARVRHAAAGQPVQAEVDAGERQQLTIFDTLG
jgi:site-specific DNA-methyltransferase (adenine-specific)